MNSHGEGDGLTFEVFGVVLLGEAKFQDPFLPGGGPDQTGLEARNHLAAAQNQLKIGAGASRKGLLFPGQGTGEADLEPIAIHRGALDLVEGLALLPQTLDQGLQIRVEKFHQGTLDLLAGQGTQMKLRQHFEGGGVGEATYLWVHVHVEGRLSHGRKSCLDQGLPEGGLH